MMNTQHSPTAASSAMPLHRDLERPGYATGPRTAEGKARSSLNALKHGLTSQRAVLPEEDGAEFEAMRQGFRDDCRPVGEREEFLVESMAVASWRLRRVWTMEPGIFANWRAKGGPLSAGAVWAVDCMAKQSLERLGRQEARIAREYHRCQKELLALQHSRGLAEQAEARRIEREAANDSSHGGNGNFAKRTPAPGACAPAQPAEAQTQTHDPAPETDAPRTEGVPARDASGSPAGENGNFAKRTPAPGTPAMEYDRRTSNRPG